MATPNVSIACVSLSIYTSRMKTAPAMRQTQAPQPAPTVPIDCQQAAAILRAADQLLTAKDRNEIAAGIEEARRRMNNEHLH